MAAIRCFLLCALFCIGLVGAAPSSMAYPVLHPCEPILQHQKSEENRQKLIGTYFALNALFPLMNDALAGGLTAFFLSQEIELAEISRPLSAAELEETFARMQSFHQANGIQAEVPKFVLESVMVEFLQTTPVRSLYSLAVLDQTRLIESEQNLFERVREFYKRPEHQNEVERLKAYGQTVLKTFRSSAVIDLSKRYRAHLKARHHGGTSSLSAQQIKTELRELMLAALLQAHPELGEEVHFWWKFQWPHPMTRAELLWCQMYGCKL